MDGGLQHFLAVDEEAPVESCLYFVYSCLAGLESNVSVGEGFNCDDYDFMIDVEVVRDQIFDLSRVVNSQVQLHCMLSKTTFVLTYPLIIVADVVCDGVHVFKSSLRPLQ
jgi:hypothetical protein